MASTDQLVRAIKELKIVRADTPIMTEREAMKVDKASKELHHYYHVFLIDLSSQQRVRVRTPAYVLDAERRPIFDETNEPKLRNPHEVGLDVLAAQGCDDHEFEMVTHGASVVATPETIATYLMLHQFPQD